MLIANNKKAYFDYFIEEKFTAGIVLAGTEVKSLRQGKCSIKESYIKIINNEAYIIGMNISPYENGNIFNKDSLRDRKLLLNKKEIRYLKQCVEQDRYTIIPLEVVIKGRYVKVEIGLAKGKKNYDKRQSIKERDLKREIERY